MPSASVIEETLQLFASSIRAYASPEREDRLWPSHPAVFATNPMSFAYGATGTAVFLQRTEGGLPTDVRLWLQARQLSVEAYPPGLYVGLAGISYALHELGLCREAAAAMDACYHSPLLNREASMFLGCAGWGYVSLWLYTQTGSDHYTAKAREAVDLIIDNARIAGRSAYWLSSGDSFVHYGYGYGASGVGLFLLWAGMTLGRADAVTLAAKALNYDIEHRSETIHGWSWVPHSESKRMLPYWAEGAAGVGKVAIRYWLLLGDSIYLQWAKTIAESVSLVWTSLPSLVEGLAGIGDFLVDMYVATGDMTYLLGAERIADAVLWYRVDRPEGTFFPGRWLNRFSFDYASGAAGVGLFLWRFLGESRRALTNVRAATDVLGQASGVASNSRPTRGVLVTWNNPFIATSFHLGHMREASSA